MNIGILTYHRALNFGAQLQAYATMTYLRDKGHNAVIIDYWPEYHRLIYKQFSLKIFLKLNFKEKISYFTNFIFTIVRQRLRIWRASSFVSKYLKVSNETNYDLIIYGSDQIWRKQNIDGKSVFNSVYFGDDTFCAKKKISYAASMGDIECSNASDLDFLRAYLSKFDSISVREEDLNDFLNNTVKVCSQLVCDPVLLLSNNQWVQFINKKVIPKQRYVFYYRLQDDDFLDSIVEKVAKQLNLKIVEVRKARKFKYGERYKSSIDSRTFISLLSGADYVITSSFHGIALSICFGKQFWCHALYKLPRITSILSYFEINDRFIKSYNDINFEKKIDYELVNTKLNILRHNSRLWLNKHIQDEESSTCSNI